MVAQELFDSLANENLRASITWLKNPSGSLREVFIEPWASTIYLLPHRQYAVVTESGDATPPPGATVELGDPIAVWPQGTASNRVYRDDGDLVWDDAEPSEVYPIIPEHLVQPLLRWARSKSQTHPDVLREFLESALPLDEMRSGLPLLLIEHGLLSLDEHGHVFDPRHKKPKTTVK